MWPLVAYSNYFNLSNVANQTRLRYVCINTVKYCIVTI